MEETQSLKYRRALRNIMGHISEHWGETFPGDHAGIDAIINEYTTLGWFDEETNPLPDYYLDNPEVPHVDANL